MKRMKTRRGRGYKSRCQVDCWSGGKKPEGGVVLREINRLLGSGP